MLRGKFDIPVLIDVSNLFYEVLLLITKVKINRVEASNFAARLEEFVNTLGQKDKGLLELAGPLDQQLLMFHLTTLCKKLREILAFVKEQSGSGWLKSFIDSKANGSASFRSYDDSLVIVMNMMINAISSNILPFRQVTYTDSDNIVAAIRKFGKH
jgi:hypothetical protein